MKRRSWGMRMLEVLLWVVAASMVLLPLWLLVSVAFKTGQDAYTGLALPDPWYFGNFATAWTQGGLGRAFLVSLLITVVSVGVAVLISALAAYPLSRVTSRWSSALFGLFMLGVIIPANLAVFPLYSTMLHAGLVGNVSSVILIYIGQTIPLTVFLYTGFLRGLPRDYEEAARIDGAGWFRTFRSVVFPLMRPVTGTAIVVSGINVYNDFFVPLLYLNGGNNVTVPLALRQFASTYFTNNGVIFAGLLMALVPVLIFYILLQKRVITGFAGGLKG
jgi:raffinose/stachyose/melibiose transport system permease protein